jgi:mannitol-1-phosphate 5-dehydrogenase
MSAKRFVGFGFGPIQAGLMLYEAAASGSFDSYTVAEVDAALVQAVRGNGDQVSINVAKSDGVSTVRLQGIRLLNPRVQEDRAAIVRAVRDADEMATAIPSVNLYSAGGDASIASLIAEGVDPEKPRIVYTAENNNFAAEILHGELSKKVPAARLSSLQLLNTVVGKMSGVISSAAEMKSLGLAPLVPGWDKCVLVEQFNHIYVTKIALAGFRRGIRVFEEKEDLLPFEEAKLFGHNAIHALLGYLASERGLAVMSAVRQDGDLMALGRRAFLEESGAALIRKHAGLGDPLFTEAGYAAYADDLLQRMTNPYLNDRVERIVRDPRRKLGYGDRLFGTMREALAQGITPSIMAQGAAAAVRYALQAEVGAAAVADPAAARRWLLDLWAAEKTDAHRERCLELVLSALRA